MSDFLITLTVNGAAIVTAIAIMILVNKVFIRKKPEDDDMFKPVKYTKKFPNLQQERFSCRLKVKIKKKKGYGFTEWSDWHDTKAKAEENVHEYYNFITVDGVRYHRDLIEEFEIESRKKLVPIREVEFIEQKYYTWEGTLVNGKEMFLIEDDE